MFFRVPRPAATLSHVTWFKRSAPQGDDDTQPPAQPSPAPVSGKKGRPTPKRREAEARGLRPVVPADRKAAKKAARQKRDEAWTRQQNALRTGDERYYPRKDQGPVKRYIRDYVDARYSLGEVFVPGSLLLLLTSVILSALSPNPVANLVVLGALYGVFILSILDALLCYFRLRPRLWDKFGKDKVKAQGPVLWYAFGRCFTLRRWRSPKAVVGRGEFPH